MAYSGDRGRKWTKYAGNPIIPHIVGANRDPKVIWHAPSGKWVMALYMDGHTYAFFSSADMKKWEKMSEIDVPGATECPDLFEMPVYGSAVARKWVFVVGNGDYMIGRFDGRQFHPETELLKGDYGPNYYSTQTWSDIPADKHIQITWMREGAYPDMPFTQQMTFPCELILKEFSDGPRICRLPVESIASLYAVDYGEMLTSVMELELLDIDMTVHVDNTSEIHFDFRGTEVSYFGADGSIRCLDRSMPAHVSGGVLELRLLLDRTSLEIFAGGGRSVMSRCILPAAFNRCVRLDLGGAQPVSMRALELKSSWQTFGETE
jgi:fructan beta-fructosidase